MAEPAAGPAPASGPAPVGGPPLVRLDRVNKLYNIGRPSQTQVLTDINLSLATGDFCALIGPSGSGKSTLLNIIGLLDRPSSGELLIDGKPTSRQDDRGLTRLRGQLLGFVFQYHHLINAFTALENVMLPMIAQRGHATSAIRERARELLAQTGLTAFADHRANDLSGGQQQRVAIARALVMQPRLVLADEPTGNLDTRSADSVFQLMRDENQRTGTTFLIVTHNLDLARRCDRLIQVVDGRIESDGPQASAKRGIGGGNTALYRS